MKAQILAIRSGGGGGEIDIKSSRDGDLRVAQYLPPLALIVAAGKGFEVMAASAAACLATGTRPTTAALGTLWNGEDGGGKCYVISRVFAQQVGSDETSRNRFGIYVCNHGTLAGATAPVADITAIRSLRGDSGYSGNARFDVGATVVDEGWFPIGNSETAEERQTTGGSQISIPVKGMYVVQPQHAFSIHCTSNDTNITVRVGVTWFEVVLDLS